MSAPAALAIDVAHVSRRFGAREAVLDVTFTAAYGETLVLLGPNGAGKTTTLRMIAGLLAPSSGRATVAGVDVASAGEASRLRAQVGLLTEVPGLWDRLTVELNLLTYARLHGLREPVAAVRRALERLQIADRAGDVAATLSKGLRQRVALARTLLHSPRVVLLDEPTSGLDPAAAKDVRDVIRALGRDGAAVVVCTHNLVEAEQVADRVGVVKTRLLALASAADLRSRAGASPPLVVDVEGAAEAWRPVIAAWGDEISAEGSRLRLRLAREGTTPDVVAALVGAGARVTAVGHEQPSLEQAYLALVGQA
jgi:ABC-2 type transport system ATP-binding protein